MIHKPIQNDFAKNRQTLLEKVRTHQGCVLLHAANIQYRNGDVAYPFYQDPNFYYLTGLPIAHAILLLHPDLADDQAVLFIKQQQSESERHFFGQLETLDNIAAQHGFSTVLPLDTMAAYCEKHIREDTPIYAMPDLSQSWVQSYFPACSILSRPLRDVRPWIHEMRLIKTPHAIASLQKAVDISTQAHIKVMQRSKPSCYEYEILATLSYEFKRNGCLFEAYPSIVAGGDRATILHYQDNNQRLKDGDLLLIDAGCVFEYYNADLTRTFPVNGHFTPRQADLYQAVLDAQEAVIQIIRPGIPWQDLEDTANRHLTESLIDLTLLKGTVDEQLEKRGYRAFFTHSVGHWLGMDVHDVGDYQYNKDTKKKMRRLKAGMVLTVEPGLYISATHTGVAEKWRGMGIRIEDNVLVTDTGHRVLSQNLPKSIDTIETLMQES